MTATKISDLVRLLAANVNDVDELPIVDKSDTSQGAGGSTKRITYADLVAATETLVSSTAATTLASAEAYADAKPSTTAVAANRTFAVGDEGNTIIETTTATNHTLTVPANATAAFAVGSEIRVQQIGTGSTTFVGAGGVTVNAANGLFAISAQYGSALLRKRATDIWILEVS